jgi:uncharacterized membrane protein HdeD (DUF308 family)
MEYGLARLWWHVALRGVLAILLGALAIISPGLLWLLVVSIFAAFALLDGALAFAAAARGHAAGDRWWALILEGIVAITAGVLAIVWPGAAELALLYLIAAWSIIAGIFEIIAAVRLRRYIEGEWALALSGVLSVILGLLLGLVPLAGLIVVAWWVGAYFIALGVLMLVVAFRLRGLVGHMRRSQTVGVP